MGNKAEIQKMAKELALLLHKQPLAELPRKYQERVMLQAETQVELQRENNNHRG